MKVGGCQQKASHLGIKLHPVSNRFKYHFHVKLVVRNMNVSEGLLNKDD